MNLEALPKRRRRDLIDVARGAALVAMTSYHLTWDLAFFRFIPPTAPFSPAMRLYSHAIASSFLILVGVSLALAHNDGAHWRAFFVRFVKVAAAAATVSAASALFAPADAIWFGILHCIAAASLASAPFLRAPVGVALAAGIGAIAAPWLYQSAAFDAPAWQWIGLGLGKPLTLDWRPFLPWAGVVWLGFGFARLLLPRLADSAALRWRAYAWPTRALAFLGRHSLAYYLTHQLALFALVYSAAYLRAWLR